MVVIDIGPQRPIPPVRPAVLDLLNPPPGRDGDPRVEPETKRYNARVADYERLLVSYDADRAAWLAEFGGAAEIEGDFVSLCEMLERDPARYVRELPEGIKPGHRWELNRIHISSIKRA